MPRDFGSRETVLSWCANRPRMQSSWNLTSATVFSACLWHVVQSLCTRFHQIDACWCSTLCRPINNLMMMITHKWDFNVAHDKTCLQSEWRSTDMKPFLGAAGIQILTWFWKPCKRPKHQATAPSLGTRWKTSCFAKFLRVPYYFLWLPSLFLHQQWGSALTHVDINGAVGMRSLIHFLPFLLWNSPILPSWPNRSSPVTRRAFISCFHTDTGCL